MERARRVWKLPVNPVRDLDRPRTAPPAGGIDVDAPEEILALVRAAEDEQDAALFLTAAFTGLRQGELIALRWRDVDFQGQHIRVTGSYTTGALTSPKSGRVRSVPMAPAVAEALARLSQREHWTGDDDPVFPGAAGWYLDASALVKCYKRALAAAGLRPLRFHKPAPHVRHGPARPTSSASRSGWATPTSRRRASACTSSRARTTLV